MAFVALFHPQEGSCKGLDVRNAGVVLPFCSTFVGTTATCFLWKLARTLVYSGILVPPQNEQLIPENRPGSESKQDCLRILYWYIRLFAVILVPWIARNESFNFGGWFGYHSSKMDRHYTWAMKKTLGCLGYIRDYTTQLYGDYNIL